LSIETDVEPDHILTLKKDSKQREGEEQREREKPDLLSSDTTVASETRCLFLCHLQLWLAMRFKFV